MKTTARIEPSDDYLKKMIDALDQLHEDSATDVAEELSIEEKRDVKTPIAPGIHSDHMETSSGKPLNKVVGSNPPAVAFRNREIPRKKHVVPSSIRPPEPPWRTSLREVLFDRLIPAKKLVAAAQFAKSGYESDFVERFHNQVRVPKSTKVLADRSMFEFDGEGYAEYLRWTAPKQQIEPSSDRFVQRLARNLMLVCVEACTNRLYGRPPPMDLKPYEPRVAWWHCLSLPLISISGNTGMSWLSVKKQLEESTNSELGVSGERQSSDAHRYGKGALGDALSSLADDFEVLGYDVYFTTDAKTFLMFLRSPEYVLEIFGKDGLTARDHAWLRRNDIRLD